MNPHQAGFVMGAILGGAAIGSICGLVPLALASQKNRLWLGLGGYFACVAGGLFLGMILAIPLAGMFAIWIARSQEASPLGIDRKMYLARTRDIVLYYFFCVTAASVGWSYFMALWLNKSFIQMLLPAGVGFGLFMGIFMTAMMAIIGHTGQVNIAFVDREGFVSQLTGVLHKLRFRLFDQSGDELTFEPGTLRRPAYSRIRVHLDPSMATLTGPYITIRLLKRRLEKAKAQSAGSLGPI